MKWTLQWSRKTNGAEEVPMFEATVATVEELDRELDHVTELAGRTDPLLVDLYDADDPTGCALGIGVGEKASVVTWTPPDGAPGAAGSKGEGAGTELWFVWAGEPSPFAPDAAVSVKAARQAAREFFETSRRPTSIAWDDA